MTKQEIMLNEYKSRFEIADKVLTETRAKLAKAEHDRDRYKAEIERLKAQQQEIERLKAENETYCKQINQAYDTGYDDGYESCQDDIKKADGRENYDLKAENKQLKTECALLDDELRIARQNTIDVLNELKEHTQNAIDTYYNSDGGGYYLAEDVIDDIDKMIEELTK